jgi:hypothetical protein
MQAEVVQWLHLAVVVVVEMELDHPQPPAVLDHRVEMEAMGWVLLLIGGEAAEVLVETDLLLELVAAVLEVHFLRILLYHYHSAAAAAVARSRTGRAVLVAVLEPGVDLAHFLQVDRMRRQIQVRVVEVVVKGVDPELEVGVVQDCLFSRILIHPSFQALVLL